MSERNTIAYSCKWSIRNQHPHSELDSVAVESSVVVVASEDVVDVESDVVELDLPSMRDLRRPPSAWTGAATKRMATVAKRAMFLKFMSVCACALSETYICSCFGSHQKSSLSIGRSQNCITLHQGGIRFALNQHYILKH